MTGNWYRLDNAARVFAALATRRTTAVFRIAATLRSPVDRATVQAALDALLPRFPYFRVRLRAGLFWHYLEEIPGSPAVRIERRAPCRRMSRTTDGPWQLRVLVFDRRISVEFSHVLTDGIGALTFLGALLAEYLSRRGVDVPANAGLPRPSEEPGAEEAEDAYRRFYDERVPVPVQGRRAFRLSGVPLAADDCRVVHGIVPLAPLRERSREHGVTLTELLASILLASLADIAGRTRRPIAIVTPVNLRRLWPSGTMRNFFLSVTASLDPRLGAYTLEEILRDVHHSVQGQLTTKNISRQIRRHVGAERNLFIRHIPLILKVPAKRRLYTWRWGARHTMVLSNLGRVDLPPPLGDHVERCEAVLNPSAPHGIGCAVIGYGDSLVITFSGTSSGTGLERAFFTRLRGMGITARVETN